MIATILVIEVTDYDFKIRRQTSAKKVNHVDVRLETKTEEKFDIRIPLKSPWPKFLTSNPGRLLEARPLQVVNIYILKIYYFYHIIFTNYL